jgi:hypothetical protein
MLVPLRQLWCLAVSALVLAGCEGDAAAKAKPYERIYLGSAGLLCTQRVTLGPDVKTAVWCQYVGTYDARCLNAAGALPATFSEEPQAGELFSDWRDCWGWSTAASWEGRVRRPASSSTPIGGC